MKNLKLETIGLTELSKSETNKIDGGSILAVALVIAAGGGVILAGAAVGYGTYKLVQWATS